MDMTMLSGFFMWCSILNLGLLTLAFLVKVLCGDFVYRLHSQWFPMPRETFNVVFYALLGGYKLLVFVFNVVPWAALAILG